ncbi:hypothetical protein FPY71_07620 [Aureimonas fodinaquatilis]|uniref:Uncharacterized protein n=1 Tax=Aureimonas fodinaquatilis TaxID=2565783 RepID=A0A5B0DYU1_9HYPH|nr:hypothetical protein [Aureimonas fodinaquatilis]KAA0970379.1 hypothetical protein FPY71_07620 [Aureimonas fodinaquatilis]
METVDGHDSLTIYLADSTDLRQPGCSRPPLLPAHHDEIQALVQPEIIYQNVQCPSDGGSVYCGYGDYRIIAPDGQTQALLTYVTEPPFGDSYCRLTVAGKPFPGFAWGSHFAWTKDGRFLVFAWMEKLYDRKTAVVDVDASAFCTLPGYVHTMRVSLGPLTISDVKTGEQQQISDSAEWISYDAVRHPNIWSERAKYG